MAEEWMPGAIAKPVSYRGEAGKFVNPPIGWILHVVVGNGSPFNTFQNAVSPNRRFSHFWVAKDGTIEQYTERSNKSWAQGVGNPQYWSCETEGFPNEPLTDAQIASLAKIHLWLSAPNLLANAPGQKGIGTHYMGGIAWGGHSCPDPSPGGQGPRSHQRDAVVVKAVNVTPPASPVPPVFTKPPVTGTDPRRVARMQQLLELTADGLWGQNTDNAARNMVSAALAHYGYPNNTGHVWDIKAAQKVLNVTADGVWGPHTQAALVAWVPKLQFVLGFAQGGPWGPKSSDAFNALRNANYGKF